MEDYKELLSKHVEGIFKKYTQPGLHVCDLATGGGKSYTIGKLTCEYYPKFFDRIIILYVQNKLIDGMNREIEKFIDKEDAIKSSDKMIIRSNEEVVKNAVEKSTLEDLLHDIERNIGEQKKKGYSNNELQYQYNKIRNSSISIGFLFKMYNDSDRKNETVDNEIRKYEGQLRYNVKTFFKTYKKHLQKTKQFKNVRVDYILKNFPSLEKVYPQVRSQEKKVLLMTVHKAMLGIDPILSEALSLKDFADNKHKTLILFDESDQAAMAMRDVIIDQSLGNLGDYKNRYAKGYQSYLQYKNLIDTQEDLSNIYYGKLMEDSLQKAQHIVKANWQKKFGEIIPYKNIFLEDSEEISTFRRGVFFSGTTFKLNFGSGNKLERSYICFKKGERQFRLVHCQNEEQLCHRYDKVVPLDSFLYLINGNLSAIKLQLRNIVKDALDRRRAEFANNNTEDGKQYMGYPTLEGEIHTLLSRFEISSERLFEGQLMDFITNRKNLSLKRGNDTIKLPDPSVYSQGVQLYQEEIDERDSLHRVMLSCREINNTPEKIIYDLVISGNTSIVLCSATAASKSVINNIDIEYLKSVLGKNIHFLTKEENQLFDDLVEKTLPKNHHCKVIPLECFKYIEKRKEKVTLPVKYRNLFCNDAIEDGIVDEWFKRTREEIYKNVGPKDDPTFPLYRIYQFIETYHYFMTHDDIHSMLYFQNRSSNKDAVQMNVIASLIDSTYKEYLKEGDFEMGLPNWKNEHIFITNKLEEVEKELLPSLSSKKLIKRILVTAYGSFKAGANLQYKIPSGLKFLKGDNWENNDGMLKKDWDAIYLQCPKSYLTFNEEGIESAYEKDLYGLMLSLMMLFERGWLSKKDVSTWLSKAIMNSKLYFKEDSVTMDKAAWAQSIVEQAIGRICRTRNKPETTYILYDESMSEFFLKGNLEKSLTKEFKALAEHILSAQKQSDVPKISPSEYKRCNDANYVQAQLNRMRNNALRYTPHPSDDAEDDFEDDMGNDTIPYVVKNCQIMNQSYKQTIIKKPVIDSIDDLTDEDKLFTSIAKCYGDWKRNEHNEYFFSYKKEGKMVLITPCEAKDSKICQIPISPSSVRLDVLMKNNVIHSNFESHGYATDWEQGKLILHPEILKTDYAGEIGEEAFKAIILRYTNCTEENFAHLEGKDYELADFVINNSDGTHKVAFDVKNMNPKVEHDDKDGDMPTSDKRKRKEERLGCRVITVNMLKLPNSSMDINEISGIIDENGNILPDAIEQIKCLIEN